MKMPTSRVGLLFGILVLITVMCALRLKTEHIPLMMKQPGNSHRHARMLLSQSDSWEAPHNQNNSFILATDSTDKRGFATSLQYPGQQGAGIRALASFQCFLGSIMPRLAIPEPYFEGTKLRGMSSSRDRLNLGSLFDFDNFNTASREMGYPELVSLNKYIVSRPEQIIIVRTVNKLGNNIVWPQPAARSHLGKPECLTNSDILLFSAEEKKTVEFVKSTIAQLQSKVCVVRVVNLNVATTSFTQRELRGLLYGSWKPEEVTLCFNYWSGPYSMPLPDPAHSMNCRQNFITVGTEPQFKPSRQLLEDAEKYRRANLNGDKKMAIMFRLEKITDNIKVKSPVSRIARKERLQYSVGKIKKCIEEVKTLKDVLSTDHNSIPVVTLDVGSLGSSSLKGDTTKLLSMANYTLASLTHDRWTMRRWEESYAGFLKEGKKSKSYVAALQRTLASQSECLVLVGGGNFQALALQDYMRGRQPVTDVLAAHHGRREEVSSSGRKLCVHVLCASRKNEGLIKHILMM